MRNGLSWLTLSLTGLLLAAPSCGGDEATGDDDGGTLAKDSCEICETSGECRRPQACIELTGAPGVGVCSAVGDTSCCTDDRSSCRSDLTGRPIEDGAGGSSGGRGGNGGSGGSILTGSGGTSGSSSGNAGSGGSISPNTTDLGAACDSDSDCGDDLTCLKTLEDGNSIPNGMCTIPCTSDGNCLEITDVAYCAEFSDGQSYCVEGCFTGSDPDVIPKCHERPDVACTIIGLNVGAGETECETSNDCPGDQLCSTDGQCGDIVTGCSPTCAGDFDCGDGVCNFQNGLCAEEKSDDLLPIGAPCTVPDEGDDEPCDGFCVPLEQGSSDGSCEAFCLAHATFAGCGYEGINTGDKPEAGCLFGTIISPPDPENGGRDVGPNDVMICGKLCDCNDDCPIPDEFCFDESDDPNSDEEVNIQFIFNRKGYCRGLLSGETESDSFDECPGSGGSGGTGGNGGGAGETSGGGGEAGEPTAAGQGGQGGA